MTKLELAWLAGLLDADGSFSYKHGNKERRKKKTPCIRITMTDEDTVQKVGALWSRAVNRKHSPSSRAKGYQPLFTTCVAGADAVALMKQLRPWMSKRRQARIDELVVYHETPIDKLYPLEA